MTLLLIFAAYLVGSIPTGVLLGRSVGLDPRRAGSGNIGATNVARTAGRWLGVLTLVGDALKGALPVLIANVIAADAWVAAAVGVAAIGGHMWSCFLGFRGGKGVATALGVFVILAPRAVAVAFVAFSLTALATRYVSLASIIAVLVLSLSALVEGSNAATLIAVFSAAIAIVVKHRDNISRLRAGTEHRFSVMRDA